MDFTRVVEWTKHRGPDAFHVPEMKELMRDRGEELPVVGLGDEIVFPNGDVCRIQVLDAVGCLRLNLEKEYVFPVREFPEHFHRSFDDVLNIRCNLRRAHRDIAFTEDQVVTRSSALELEDFEFTDECRRIDED